MQKILEKALKDAIKEKKITMGSHQVLNSIKNSKLVVVSHSLSKEISEKINDEATNSKIPLLQFAGSSVELGRLSGVQFRVSSLSFNSLSDSNIKSILKEAKSN